MQPAAGYPVAEAKRRGAIRVPRPALVRILHVINGEHYAGAERVQDHLALRLPECGFEVGFACLKPNQFGPLRQAQDAALHEVPMDGRFDLRPAAHLASLIRGHGYAVVHTHSPRTAMVGCLASRLAGVPMVHHAHSQTPVEIGHGWIRRISDLVERQSLRRAAGIIAVSESLARFLQSHGYARRQIWLVPNGVPAHDELSAWPRAAGRWTVGVVALFRPRKGLEVLLDALASLRAARLPVSLRAVGRFETPAYERSVRQRADKLGLTDCVDWVGFRADVHAEMRQMDVFVLPSVLSEGMPMALLEAMAAGTPVVATRVDGVTDIVREGDDGLLAEPGNADDLARALGSIVRGEADGQRLRRNAQQRQIACFSDRSMAAGVARVYRDVLRL